MSNSTPEMQELLMRYLDGELSADEKQEFELRLSADPALQSAYDNLLLTREAVRQYGLRQDVGTIHKEMMKELKPPPTEMSKARRITRYGISIAATIVLLVGGYMAYTFMTLTPEKIMASNYRVYELTPVRSGDSSETEVEKKFRARDYKGVLRLLAITRDSTNSTLFLGGISSIETKNPSKGIILFSRLIEKNRLAKKTEWNNEAEYYLALSYISNRDYDLAMPLLEKIHDDTSHLYHDKVSKGFMRRVRMLKWK